MGAARAKPNPKERKLLNELVAQFDTDKAQFERFAGILHDDIARNTALKRYVKFVKWRVKDNDHLRDKLERKLAESKKRGKPFNITRATLSKRITDLAGVRALHLHTEEMRYINPLLLKLFKDEQYEVVEGPVANVWDHEYQAFFKSIGIKAAVRTDTMYTSVHYVVRANNTHNTACELQVRTLSEELWGEVSHTVNYPSHTGSIACLEQLKVLARVTSSATRLVDSLFKSYDAHNSKKFASRLKRAQQLLRGNQYAPGKRALERILRSARGSAIGLAAEKVMLQATKKRSAGR